MLHLVVGIGLLRVLRLMFEVKLRKPTILKSVFSVFWFSLIDVSKKCRM
jgi:hypothetical protein